MSRGYGWEEPRPDSRYRGRPSIAQLANSPRASDRIEAAGSRGCPSTILRTLAADHEEAVRHAVARNRNSGPRTLEILSTDDATWVRRGVAANPSTPAAVLIELLSDSDPDAAHLALTNEAMPTHIKVMQILAK